MPVSRSSTTIAPLRRGRVPVLSDADCAEIAASFDGTTQRIDALLGQWKAARPGLKRHNIVQAAKRGGYRTAKKRKAWSKEDDKFIVDNWHRMSGDEVAGALGRTFDSVNLRRKRLGVGRYDGDELTVRDLEELTRIDHRQWHDFIERGWLNARHRARRNGAAPITYVSLNALRRMLEVHPEVCDYRAASKAARVALELDKLPEPPQWKRVVCRSKAWTTQIKATPVGRRVSHGAAELHALTHTYKQRSCAEEGGVAFWAPTYAFPSCPRCGCQVSRYSEEALFTDLDPGNDELIDIQARKIGLRWDSGKLRDSAGRDVTDRDILDCLFSAGRCNRRSVKAFDKLIEAGLSVVQSKAVPEQALLDNILSIALRPDQEEALQQFVATGNMTAAHAMSFGKSTLGMMAMTRIAGRHLLMVDTQLLREQWIEKLTQAAPRVKVTRWHKPAKSVVRVFDCEGSERCVIEIYNYMTRTKLEGPWVVGCFDEVHRLPAALAHRHSFAPTQYRIGLSATADLRGDGRGALVSKMTGALVGEDWRRQMETGIVKRIPVKVFLVEDTEHKHEVVGQLLQKHASVVVLCEALADGRELELRYGIPFIHSKTKQKLQRLRASQSMVLSRVGDAGISVPHCEVTVDHSGLFGSRIQSLQRLGRLMHSDRALYHCILMTRAERYERFAARVEAIKAKGFTVTEVVAPRQRATVHPLLTPVLQARVSARDNPFLAALGWRKDDLIDAA